MFKFLKSKLIKIYLKISTFLWLRQHGEDVEGRVGHVAVGVACPLVLTWPHPLSPPPLQLHASSPPQQQEPKTGAFQCLFCSHVHVKTTRSDRGNMCIHSPTKAHPVWGKVAMGTCVWSLHGPGEFLTGGPRLSPAAPQAAEERLA